MTKKRARKIDRKLTKPDTPKRGRPRQQDLPGTENRAIRPLEALAAEYVDIRDQRMALTEQESPLRERLLKLMKKLGRETYRRDGILIEIVHEKEKVRVKIKKAGSGDDADADSSEESDRDEESDEDPEDDQEDDDEDRERDSKPAIGDPPDATATDPRRV